MASNIRIQFKINTITRNGKSLTINLAADYYAWAIRFDNDDLANAAGTTNRLRGQEGSNPAAAFDPKTLRNITIDCKDSEEAILAENLLQYKNNNLGVGMS